MMLGSKTRYVGAPAASTDKPGAYSLRDWLAYYEAHGRAPFPLAGAEGEQDADKSQADDDSTKDNADKSQADDGDKTDEPLSADKARKLRSEAKNLRDRLRAAEGERDTFKADLDSLKTGGDAEVKRVVKERDTWKERYETLSTSLKGERLKGGAIEAATKAGAIDAGVVAKLINAADVEWGEGDDEYTPKGIEAVIERIKKDHPKLFGSAAGKGNGGERDEKQRQDFSSPINRMAAAYANK